jgi:hypothetical protein
MTITGLIRSWLIHRRDRRNESVLVDRDHLVAVGQRLNEINRATVVVGFDEDSGLLKVRYRSQSVV